MTLETLHKAIENKGWKIKDYVLEDFRQSGQLRKVGFSTGRGVWYWFTYYTKGSMPGYLFWDHRYSQNNGKVSKSFRTGGEAKRMIKRAAKVD